MYIDLSFPVRGDVLPMDHHYLLYGALSHAIRAFHAADGAVRFAVIGGSVASKGMIAVGTLSRLRVRLLAEHIGQVMPLAGCSLKVGEHSIALGVPTVYCAPGDISNCHTLEERVDLQEYYDGVVAFAAFLARIGELVEKSNWPDEKAAT